MKLAIVGSQDIADDMTVQAALSLWFQCAHWWKREETEFATSCVETGVPAIVRRLFPPAEVFCADWNRFGSSGAAERNKRMASSVDGLIAIPSIRSAQTWDALRRANRKKKTTLLYRSGGLGTDWEFRLYGDEVYGGRS